MTNICLPPFGPSSVTNPNKCSLYEHGYMELATLYWIPSLSLSLSSICMCIYIYMHSDVSFIYSNLTACVALEKIDTGQYVQFHTHLSLSSIDAEYSPIQINVVEF